MLHFEDMQLGADTSHQHWGSSTGRSTSGSDVTVCLSRNFDSSALGVMYGFKNPAALMLIYVIYPPRWKIYPPRWNMMKLASISNFKLAWSMLRFHAQFLLQTSLSPARLLPPLSCWAPWVLSYLRLQDLQKVPRQRPWATDRSGSLLAHFPCKPVCHAFTGCTDTWKYYLALWSLSELGRRRWNQNDATTILCCKSRTLD